jgi:hypothetical protein
MNYTDLDQWSSAALPDLTETSGVPIHRMAAAWTHTDPTRTPTERVDQLEAWTRPTPLDRNLAPSWRLALACRRAASAGTDLGDGRTFTLTTTPAAPLPEGTVGANGRPVAATYDAHPHPRRTALGVRRPQRGQAARHRRRRHRHRHRHRTGHHHVAAAGRWPRAGRVAGPCLVRRPVPGALLGGGTHPRPPATPVRGQPHRRPATACQRTRLVPAALPRQHTTRAARVAD